MYFLFVASESRFSYNVDNFSFDFHINLCASFFSGNEGFIIDKKICVINCIFFVNNFFANKQLTRNRDKRFVATVITHFTSYFVLFFVNAFSKLSIIKCPQPHIFLT